MFSLIITIVSIALVVALVAATMYHGGDTLTQGRNSADASAYVNGAQQVAAAAVMQDTTTGALPADAAAQVAGKFLTSIPVVKGVTPAIDGVARTISYTGVTPAVCTQINSNAGSATPSAQLDLAGVTYGCITATKVFSFKF